MEFVRYNKQPVETSTIERDGKRQQTLRGLAAVYYNPNDPGTEFNLFGNAYERIQPGAFDGMLDGEIFALWNHNFDSPLGKTPNNLKLWTDEVGLRYEIKLADTTLAKDLLANVKAGVVTDSSFRFTLDLNNKDQAEWTKDGEKDVFAIKRLNTLDEISVVTNGAYKSAGVDRSFERKTMQLDLETEKRIAYLNTITI